MDYGDIKGVGVGAVKMIAINMLITCKAKYKLLVMRICLCEFSCAHVYACVLVCVCELRAMNNYRVLKYNHNYFNATLNNPIDHSY